MVNSDCQLKVCLSFFSLSLFINRESICSFVESVTSLIWLSYDFTLMSHVCASSFYLHLFRIYISLVLILHLHLSTYFLHLYCTYISLVLQPLLYLHLLCTYYIFLLCLHLPCTYIFLLDLCLYFSYICCYSPNSHTSLSRTCIILTFVLYLAVTAQSSIVQCLNFGYLTPFVTFSWQLHASADYSYLSGIASWITLELSLSLSALKHLIVIMLSRCAMLSALYKLCDIIW